MGVGTPKSFSDNQALFALIASYLLSDIFSLWLAAPLARGLGFFLGVTSLALFARRQGIDFRRILKLALLAAMIVVVWSLILSALGLKW